VICNLVGLDPTQLGMWLTFAAIHGGMVTLIGSSTNLLVSGMLIELGDEGFSFFQFAVPGEALALVGTPLVIIVWLIFSLVASWYYGLS
jgi:di/tricarboxylate transporter